MHILVLNSGSSSIKFALFATADEGVTALRVLLEGEASDLGTDAACLKTKPTVVAAYPLQPGAGPDEAGETIAALLNGSEGFKPDSIGYRIVHPGPNLHDHTPLTAAVLKQLRAAVRFAPLHQPAALRLIEAMSKHLPGVQGYCCFDTVFHQTMPAEASTYALPAAVRADGVHRYGFHGLSCESVITRLRARAERPLPRRLIVAHLGSGASVTAILDGASIDTSMGLTPDGGIVMGTRPGDLDPGVVLYLIRRQAETVNQAEARTQRSSPIDAVEQLLNRDSGVHAVSELPNDTRAVRKAAAQGNTDAQLSLRVFSRSVRKAIGSYVALMGGVDCLVFTGGIGEHDAESRAEICAGLDVLGLRLDSGRNEIAPTDATLHVISTVTDPAEILVVPAEEDRTIATHVLRMMRHPLTSHHDDSVQGKV